MSPSHSLRRQSGFSIIELLIVVVILGLLAAIVVPKLDYTVAEARKSALKADLNHVRNAVAMYQVQHVGVYPGQSSWNQFTGQLTYQTNSLGHPDGELGPYLRDFPKNPVSQMTTGKLVNVMPSTPDGTTGWIYCPVNGEFRANTPGVDPDGIPYFSK